MASADRISRSLLCDVCDEYFGISTDGGKDAYAPALLAFACIRLLILLVPLSLALRPYWSYKGKSDKARRYGVLLAILFAVIYETLLVIRVALQLSQSSISGVGGWFILIFYVLSSLAWRVSELFQAVFLPRIVLEQLALRGVSTTLHVAVKSIAIAFFVAITALNLASVGILSSLLAVPPLVPLNRADMVERSRTDLLSKTVFAASLLWIVYATCFFTAIAAKGLPDTTSLTTRLFILSLFAMALITQLVNTILNGLTAFASGAVDDKASIATYYISQVTLTILLTLAALLGTKRFRENTLNGTAVPSDTGAGAAGHSYPSQPALHYPNEYGWYYPQSIPQAYGNNNAYMHPSTAPHQYGYDYQPQQSTLGSQQQPVGELSGYTRPHEMAGYTVPHEMAASTNRPEQSYRFDPT